MQAQPDPNLPEIATPSAGTSEVPAVALQRSIAEELPVTHVVVRRTNSAVWAVASVFVAAIAAATFLIYSFTVALPSKVIETGGGAVASAVEQVAHVPERLAGAFKPTVNVNTLVNSGIDKVKHESKLIVMTADVDVEIGKTSEKKVLWESLNLGETTVRLRARDNKVQYYVPLQQFGKDQIEYSPETNAIVVRVPQPVLDASMVSVQSDPSYIDTQTDVGWGRLKMYSGEFLLEKAKAELRDAVLCEGANPLLQEKARSEAQTAVRSLLAEWLPNLREGVNIQVQFI